MDNKKIQELAYFRYGVISPLLAAHDALSLKHRLQEQAAKVWTLPDGRLRQIAWGTIEKWLYRYRRGGLPALTAHPRKDCGSFRQLPDSLAQALVHLRAQHPTLTAKQIIKLARELPPAPDPHMPSNSTLYRYLRTQCPPTPPPTQERRSFEAPYAGSLWQTDIMNGPFLSLKDPDGKYRKRPTYLVAILDDHSRLLCHAQFYLHQNLPAYLHTFKTACQKRGLPEKLYCDNGQVFLSHQIKRIAAELGILILHTRVRDAAAKGKIERFFQTLQQAFLEPLMALTPPTSLADLNHQLWRWCEQDYNHQPHSAIATTPINRFLLTAARLRQLAAEEHDHLFLFEDQRRVKKDGTFTLHNRRFETDWTLAGKTVTIHYDPSDPLRVYVGCEGVHFGRAQLLDVHSNFNRPRTPNPKGKTP